MEGFNFEEYRTTKIQEAIDQKIKDSIYVKSKRIKISDKLAYDVEKDRAVAKSKHSGDKRFEKVLTDKEFQIEEEKDQYILRNSSRVRSSLKRI